MKTAAKGPTDVGQCIKYWREKKNLSIAEVARAVEVDPSALSHWEAGRANPQMKHVVKLATVFGISMRKFWSRIDATKAAS